MTRWRRMNHLFSFSTNFTSVYSRFSHNNEYKFLRLIFNFLNKRNFSAFVSSMDFLIYKIITSFKHNSIWLNSVSTWMCSPTRENSGLSKLFCLNKLFMILFVLYHWKSLKWLKNIKCTILQRIWKLHEIKFYSKHGW